MTLNIDEQIEQEQINKHENKIQMEKKEKIGAWKKSTPKGDVIEFTINNQKYSMWPNTYKKEDKHPDFQIVVNDYKPNAEAKKEYASTIEAVNIQEAEDLPF